MSQTKQKQIESDVIAVLADRGYSLTAKQLAKSAASVTCDIELESALLALTSNGKLRLRNVGSQAYYSIAPANDWPDENMTEVSGADVAAALAELQPVSPTEARFGLWSDGTLSIESSAGRFDLEPDECHALMQYLIRSRDNAVSVFCSAGGTA